MPGINCTLHRVLGALDNGGNTTERKIVAFCLCRLHTAYLLLNWAVVPVLVKLYRESERQRHFAVRQGMFAEDRDPPRSFGPIPTACAALFIQTNTRLYTTAVSTSDQLKAPCRDIGSGTADCSNIHHLLIVIMTAMVVIDVFSITIMARRSMLTGTALPRSCTTRP